MDDKKTGKTIIIMGTGASVRFCDFNMWQGKRLPDSEVWGVNGTYTIPGVMPKHLRKFFTTDKLFMTDSLFSHEEGTLNFDITGMNKFAKKYKCQLISLNKLNLGKYKMNARGYPYKRITEYFGTEYFTDTICYMIAYALYTNTHLARSTDGIIRPELKQPVHLRLFGIDMSTTREFQQSKAGVEFWLGMARMAGCEIFIAPGGTIMKAPFGVPYGHWNRLKITKKKYDPFGVMNGKEPTTADADKLAEKMKNEQGNSDTNTQWGESNNTG